MLLIKNIAEGEIASFKLVNGDEVVARVAKVLSAEYQIENPCIVVPSQQGFGLMQAMFTVDPDATMTLQREHILLMGPTVDAMKKHYIKTTTGIETVSGSFL
jgi:hypothetical protein